ncbi:NUDIX domain-containing protein [Streptomyces rhizosphaerihabitans]|uniref:NUDIX domain-containing protein n=1 Tax=Streptomyces rhizosphaerihabitans TaxID=1266770 RepID=UPI0021BF133C|nr:NUDIX domain-containing protein [Streptomyces rhizosphaerihabitans]MCT9011355.1 NUDIX domain-containing protein [Streptomyces rhizosphaerihabitans]
MTNSTPPLGEANRTRLLDADQRVLARRGRRLLGDPGGSLEEGGTYAKATLRGLREELGVEETAVELRPQLAEGSKDPRHSGRSLCAPEGESAVRGFYPLG